MRLTQPQLDAIGQTVAETFGSAAFVWLFGSRVDGIQRGGDIDHLIWPDPSALDRLLMRKIRFLGKLAPIIGERKINVIIESLADARSIVKIEYETGVRL